MLAMNPIQFLGATLLALASSLGAAQGIVAKPITVIVPYSAGGTTDITARIVAQKLSDAGSTAVVDNRAGAGGVIGWSLAAKSPPDGATIVTTDTSFSMSPGLHPKLVVNPSVPAKTAQEFIVLAKTGAGDVNYGSGGNGSSTHLGAELFRSVTGVPLTHVPYKGASQAMQDLMAGQVQVLFTAVPTALPHIKSGKLRALLVTSDKRVAALPDVPSAPEAGVPKMLADNWFGFAVPANTPKEIVDKLNKAIVIGLNAPDSRKRFADLGLNVVGNSPAEAAKLVDEEIQRWGALIKSANIKAD